jgi:kynurenine formamidase
MNFIDLTHDINDMMPTFPGDEMLRLKQTHKVSVDGHSNFHLSTGLHVGTHIDSPAHFIENAKRICSLTLDNLCGDAIVLDARGRDEIGVDILSKKEILSDNLIVVICTSYYKNYKKASYYYDYPILSNQLCNYFISKKVKMIALDTPSPDKSPYQLHPLLFNAGIIIAENLTNTEDILELSKFRIFAVPLKIDADGSPARIFAQYDTDPE